MRCVQSIEADKFALTMGTIRSEEEDDRMPTDEIDMARFAGTGLLKGQCGCGITRNQKAHVGGSLDGNNEEHWNAKNEHKSKRRWKAIQQGGKPMSG
jgi:hypothetical protein